MREYFLGLILFAFLGSAILSVAPEGIGRGYLRFLCGLCSLGCVIFPLVSLTGSAGELRGELEGAFEVESEPYCYAEIYNSFLDETAVKNAELELKNEILSEIKAKNEGFDLNIILGENSGEIYIRCVQVIFYPSGYHIDPRVIENICLSRLKCECEFFYR